MQEIQVSLFKQLEKGKVYIRFENDVEMVLYRSEWNKLSKEEKQLLQTEEVYVSNTLYQKLLKEILGIRVKKRALMLLERMDRTEKQLFDKLMQSKYPQVCVEAAIAYVKEYGYIDDMKYAKHYIRYHAEKKSRQRIKMDLMKKGIRNDVIAIAMEEEYASDEQEQIRELLIKRHYDIENKDRKIQQKMFQFLLRRGYRSGDIRAVLSISYN